MKTFWFYFGLEPNFRKNWTEIPGPKWSYVKAAKASPHAKFYSLNTEKAELKLLLILLKLDFVTKNFFKLGAALMIVRPVHCSNSRKCNAARSVKLLGTFGVGYTDTDRNRLFLAVERALTAGLINLFSSFKLQINER